MSEAIVASVAVEVVPSAESFGDKLRRKLIPDADRIGTEVGRMLSERIQSALGDVRVKVDTAAAKADIDLIREDLRRLGNDDARIRVSVETAAARAELDRLRADLARFGASSTTHTVRINQVGGGSSGGGGGGGFGLGLGMSLLPALIPVAAAAVPVIGGIGAALVGAAAGGGVLKAAFTGIGDAVSALGAKSAQTGQQLKQQAAQQLASQFSILNAQDAVAASVRALANAQAAAGQQAVQSAESVKNAEQALVDARRSAASSVASAERAVTDARRSAAASVANAQQGVTGAERSYTSALYTENQAQVALNQARAQAKQTLQDLSNQVKDGALSQRQATIDLQSALDNLKVVDFNPHSTAQQRAEAQLQVDQAKQHLSELELGNSRLATQKAAADKQGVANAPTVVSAEHAMANATQARVDAATSLTRSQAALVEAQRAGSEQISRAVAAETEARRAGAESVAKAQQGVSDALRQQAIQAASSQQAIISARQSEVSAQRSLAQAYASAAASGVAANNAVAESMASLTPAGRRFATFVNDALKPAWKGVTDAAQTGFLPGFQKALTILLPFLPGFAKFVGDIGRELGGMAQSAAKALTSPFWRQFGTFLGQITGPSMRILGGILGNLATGFAGLFQALAPSGIGLGNALLTLTQRFAAFGTHLNTNQGFQKFLTFVQENAPRVGQFIVNLAVVFGKLIIAFAPMGVVLAGLIEKVVSFLAALSPGQLSGLLAGMGGLVLGFKAFKALKMAEELGGLGKALGVLFRGNPVLIALTLIVGGLIYAYTHFKTFRTIVNTVAREVGVIVGWLWTNVIQPTFNWIIAHWHYVATAFKLYWDLYLHPLFDVYKTVILFLWSDVVKPTFNFIVGHWGTLASAFKTTYDTVLKPLWGVLTGAFGEIETAFTVLKTGMLAVWAALGTALSTAYNTGLKPVWSKLTGAFTTVKTAFTTFKTGMSTVWGEIKTVFTEGVNFITQNVLNKFIGAINKVTGLFGIAPIPAIPKIGAAVKPGGSSGGGGGSGSSHGNSNQLAFAHGGVVPGFAPGRDIVDAKLSPGEGVLVPEAVNGLGGASFVHAVNRHFSNRAPSSNGRHFAGGGIVGFAKGVGHKIATGADKLGDLAAAGVALPARLALAAAERIANALLSHLEPEVIRNLGAGAFGLVDRGLHSLVGRSSVAASSAAVSGPSSGSALDYARIIIGQARSMNLGPKGAEIALMTALVESNLKNYANANIPESLRVPHDAVGSDHYSAGLFQQQTGPFGNYWGTVAQVMNPAYSAHRFLDELLRKVPGYRNTDPGVAAQTVQVSAFPDAYSRRQGDADALINKVKYDNGGYLQPGVTQVYNGTGRPEPVLTDDHWQALKAAASSNQQQRGAGKIADTVNLHQVTDTDGLLMELARRQQQLMNT